MSDIKQVKVDNWGIYFLQRLKHFFNRTDYCDLTLQFQDNAQLKVHRLVLSACTEYFELLERTCEMYEDCLVMPDDLQADVVVPIVNFMYTGHLEFKMELLERLYQTSQILNMPVLSKLLESHRNAAPKISHSYSAPKKYAKLNDSRPGKANVPVSTVASSTKRSYSKAFDNSGSQHQDKKVYLPVNVKPKANNVNTYHPPSPSGPDTTILSKKLILTDPRPTRYELPEELDSDNVFDNSFCNISYESQPLMVHPETVKHYSSKRSGLFSEASSSKKFTPGMSTVDIVECKRIVKEDNIFDDSIAEHTLSDETDMFQTSYNEPAKDTNQLFDQILDQNEGPKVTIETKDNKAATNLDHAKIISEVLKKYPHLVKSNKNIKLKILNTPSKSKKQAQKPSPTHTEEKTVKLKTESDFTYETDVIDSKKAAKLIAMGAENTKGPWICLICGTPGKALHFTSYYIFRRHLVEVHNEKPVSNICEYCGLRSLKRNYLLHHLYSQHGVQPPPQYHFPKCNRCNYIALTEGLLVKHKLTHKDVRNFRCNVCPLNFNTSNELLIHIQNTGHKYSAERKANLQCIYCLKVFLREPNLYAHLKTHHRQEAKSDGIIDDSDEEKVDERKQKDVVTKIPKNDIGKILTVKYEPSTSFDDFEEIEAPYQLHHRPDGGVEVVSRKQNNVAPSPKQKILNPGFGNAKPALKPKPVKSSQPEHNDFLEEMNIPSPPNPENEDNIVLIDNDEYIMRDNQLIPRKKSTNAEYIISDMVDSASLQALQPTTSMDYTKVHQNSNIEEIPQSSMIINKTNINQPIQIVVSNEEEYKALMAANHPILFDNGDSNKTLTVLTAPHSSTMETTAIDLDNTQSNDMMIIPEEYPLNVTEAVSTDNSNIVVVYSHPVDDQSKQFQILTTGGIGTQFVQSSAIITQNYETVTTSTPVMSAHVMGTQVEQTWENNVQNIETQQVQMAPVTEIQHIVTAEHAVITPVQEVTSDNLNELPEVHLLSESEKMLPQAAQSEETPIQPAEVTMALETEAVQGVPEPVTHLMQSVEVNQTAEHITEVIENIGQPIEQIMETADQVNDNINDVSQAVDHVDQTLEQIHQSVENLSHVNGTVEQEIINETENLPITHMETDVPNENAVEEVPIAEPTVVPDQSEIISDILASNEHVNAIEQPMEVDNVSEQASLVEKEIDPQEGHSTDSVNIPQNSEIMDNTNLTTEEPLAESQAYDDIVDANQVNNEEAIYPKVADEKIQTLTSEWSEDEYDVPEDNNIETLHKESPVIQENQVITGTNEVELEESIENIQQEVQKQMATPAAPELETEESATSSQDDDSASQESSEPVVPQPTLPTDGVVDNNPEAQEKISSLLNDWEDNDSQENIVHENDVAPILNESNPDVELTPIVNNVETPQPIIEDVAAELIPKNDNIKSLVSDWDDEEDEIKE